MVRRARKNRVFLNLAKRFKLEHKVINNQKLTITFLSFWNLKTSSSPKIKRFFEILIKSKIDDKLVMFYHVLLDFSVKENGRIISLQKMHRCTNIYNDYESNIFEMKEINEGSKEIC